VAQFATTADFGEYLGETLTGTRLAQAVIALEIASGRIQGWTRQRLERVVGDVVVLNGTSDWELELPERPVISVTSVAIDGTTIAPASYRLAGDKLIRRLGGWVGPIDSLVTVTYTHGFDPIPADIWAATLAAATQLLANPLGVTQEGIGSYTVSYGDKGVGTVNDPLESLSRYRRRAWAAPMYRPGRAGNPANQ
jgi:hypothetical protein